MATTSSPHLSGRMYNSGQGPKPSEENSSDTTLMYGGLFTPPPFVLDSHTPTVPYALTPEPPFPSSPAMAYAMQSRAPMLGSSRRQHSMSSNWRHPSVPDVDMIAALRHGYRNEQSPHQVHMLPMGSMPASEIQEPNYASNYGASSPLVPLHELANRVSQGNHYPAPSQPSDPSYIYPNQDFEVDMLAMAPELDMHRSPVSSLLSQSSQQFSSSPVSPYYDGTSSGLSQSSQVIEPCRLAHHDEHSRDFLDCAKGEQPDFLHGYQPSVSDFNDYQVDEAADLRLNFFGNMRDVGWDFGAEQPFVQTPSSSIELADSSASRRRPTRRVRKSHNSSRGTCFSRYTSATGTECRFEGKKFRLEGDLTNGQINWVPEETLTSTKAHRCPHFDEHGNLCGVGFDRSEHLKRHVDTRHNKERHFPCPLPNCTDKKGNPRRIGRSDNAGDHFKTHLRPKPKGRRNKEYDWSMVRKCILEAYDPKRAAKLIEGLQRWIDAGMPEPGRR